MSAFVDHYRVLGVSPSATTEEIRQAYRRAVHRHHADRNQDDAEAATERTRLIVAARDVLCDPWRRTRFDLMRSVQPPSALEVDPIVHTAAKTWGNAPPPSPPPPNPPRSFGWGVAAVVGATGLAAALGLSLLAAATIAEAIRSKRQ